MFDPYVRIQNIMTLFELSLNQSIIDIGHCACIFKGLALHTTNMFLYNLQLCLLEFFYKNGFDSYVDRILSFQAIGDINDKNFP